MPNNHFILTITQAFKRNVVPGLVLQCFALTIVALYYYWPASHQVFNVISSLKVSYGLLFSLISTAIFGGLIPFIYLSSTQSITNNSWKVCCFYVIFWSYKGVEVDIFYTWQAYWFGTNNDFITIGLKTSIDQFIYSAFWAVPSIMVIYLWVDSNFNLTLTKKKLTRSFFFIQIPAAVISNWLVWLPAVSIVYSMPTPLQLPLFNLVLCFFVILLASLTKGTKKSDPTLN